MAEVIHTRPPRRESAGLASSTGSSGSSSAAAAAVPPAPVAGSEMQMHTRGERPSLNVDTFQPFDSSSTASGSDSATTMASETTTVLPAAAAAGRSYNLNPYHARSFSLSEHRDHHHHHSHYSQHASDSTSPPSFNSTENELVRRHHTLSTSTTSRLVRLERSKARLALAGSGLSEEDQEFYVPPSPVRTALTPAWSELGHGHARQASNDSQQSSSAKRNSFVVVRGGKGDAALSERRSAERPRTVSAPDDIPINMSESTDLRQRNSLKHVLESETDEQKEAEDWEKGIKETRERALQSSGVTPWNPSLENESLTFTPPTNDLLSLSQASFSQSRGITGPPALAVPLRSEAVSPALGITRSPWSPTYEETQQLGLSASTSNNGVKTPPLSLSRGSSGSSHGSQSQKDQNNSPPRVSSPPASAASPRHPVNGRRLPPLMTNVDLNVVRAGPQSASAFVPPIGHSHPFVGAFNADGTTRFEAQYRDEDPADFRGMATAVGTGGEWRRQKDLLVGGPLPVDPAMAATMAGPYAALNASVVPPGPPVDPAWPPAGGFPVGLAMQQQQQIQALQSQMQQAMKTMEMMKLQQPSTRPDMPPGSQAFVANPAPTAAANSWPVDSPVDVTALAKTKGYNPTDFDLRPANARFFVIKSYTEEDVHKSLKYEIWASTDLGNKRLDRAFRESASKGPIYLFFSVNGSGHFAGMAQMLTPVDYAMSSNVWASDKWKGVLKVRWIYIKDVPLAALRHIRLSNTPENKPVTSSRDTQEVPYEEGCEVLRILSSFNSRTSLLQDFQWYEAKAAAGIKGEEAGPSHYSRHYGKTTSQPDGPPSSSSSQQQQSQQQQSHSPNMTNGSSTTGAPRELERRRFGNFKGHYQGQNTSRHHHQQQQHNSQQPQAHASPRPSY